jgi:hypothetical protein
MDEEPTGPSDEQPVSWLDLVRIFQAYNRQELTYDELIECTRAWAEAMRRQYGNDEKDNKPRDYSP